VPERTLTRHIPFYREVLWDRFSTCSSEIGNYQCAPDPERTRTYDSHRRISNVCGRALTLYQPQNPSEIDHVTLDVDFGDLTIIDHCTWGFIKITVLFHSIWTL
jgi:hypothetical protein